VPVEPLREAWRRELTSRGRASVGATRAPRVLDLVAAVAIGAAVVDAVVTWLGIDWAGRLEANPLMASLMRSMGLGPVLVGGMLLRVGIVLALAFIATHAVRSWVRAFAAFTLGAAALWWAVIVFSNAVSVGRA